MKETEQKPENPYVHPIQDNTLTYHNGMTLRDHFAGLAMQAITSNIVTLNRPVQSWEYIAEGSYNIADAMLKQRSI